MKNYKLFFLGITLVLLFFLYQKSDEIEKKPYSIVAFVLQFGQVYNNNVIVSVVKRNIHFPEDQVGFHALWLDIFISLCRHCLKGFVKIGWNFGRGQSLGGLWEVFTIKKACICTAWPCKVNNILDRNENVTVIVFYFYPRIFLFHWYGCWCYPSCCRWFSL